MKESLLDKITLLLSKGLKAEHITLFLVIEELERMNTEPLLRLSASYLSELLYHSTDKTSTMNRYLNALIKYGVLFVRKEGNHYYYWTLFKNEAPCKNEDRSYIEYINYLNITEGTINNSIDSIKKQDGTKKQRMELLEILTDQYEFYRKETYHCSRKEGLTVHMAANRKVHLSDKEVVSLMSYITPDDLEAIAESLLERGHQSFSKTYITSALFHKAIHKKNEKDTGVANLCDSLEEEAKEICHYTDILEYAPGIKAELDTICSVIEKTLKMPDEKVIALNQNESVRAEQLKQAIYLLSEEHIKYVIALFHEKKGMIYNPEGYIRSMLLHAEQDYDIYKTSFGTAPVKDPLPFMRMPASNAEELEDDIDIWLLDHGIIL